MGASGLPEEEAVDRAFAELSTGFQRVAAMREGPKRQQLLARLTTRMQEAKGLIRGAHAKEIEAGEPAVAAAARKAELVQQLNGYIGLRNMLARGGGATSTSQAAPAKRRFGWGGKSSTAGGPGDAGSPAHPADVEAPPPPLSQVMAEGRALEAETDASLARSEAVVREATQVGSSTAAALSLQGDQLVRIADALEEISLSNARARTALRDMARAAATDRCMRMLLLLLVLAAAAAVAVRVAKK